MAPENDVAHEFLVLLGAIQNRGGRLNRGLEFYKPGSPQTFCRSLRILKKPRLAEAREEWRKSRCRCQCVRAVAYSNQVRPASALGLQPSPRNQRPPQVRK